MMLRRRKYLSDVNATPINLSLIKIKLVLSIDLNPNTAFQHRTFIYLDFLRAGRGSVVGMTTAYGLDGPGIESQ